MDHTREDMLGGQLLPEVQTQDVTDGARVEYQTEGVVNGFMYHLYQHRHSRQEYDDLPYTPDFNFVPTHSLEVEIGRRLACIGDDIYERHGSEMDALINKLNPNRDNVFSILSTIATKTIGDGISWGRILVLLCFGFRLFTRALRCGMTHGSLRTVVSSIAQVFILKKVTDWIARNGGWSACLNFNPSASNVAMGFVILTAALSVFVTVYKFSR